MRLEAIWGTRRRALMTICLLLVAAFAVFEIGVRLLPADAVQYKIQVSNNGSPTITRTGTITDTATVARWRAAVTADPSGQFLVGVLIAQRRGEITCAPLSYITASYVFLWHGLTVEAVSSLQTCDEQYTISRGGLPDLGAYYVTLLVQP